ncbi:MAG: DUF421 domain-containing protein [Actinobacteria bacterium]|nr:DUF421 domain-containing protein [Actinomycetota bacterium]
MDLVLRTLAVFLLLWVVTRGMGKRELAQMSPFELILLVTLGDLIQQGVTQDDRSVTGAFIAVATMTLCILVAAIVTHHSKRAQKLFEGVPVVVVRDGQALKKVLDLERISRDEVEGELRAQGIGDLRQVKLGVLEADGTFSFILADGPIHQQQLGQHRLDAG